MRLNRKKASVGLTNLITNIAYRLDGSTLKDAAALPVVNKDIVLETFLHGV